MAELLLDLLDRSNFFLHPGVPTDVGNSEALRCDRLPHSSKEVLEIIRVTSWLVAGMGSPEDVFTVSIYELVEAVVSLGFLEWRMTTDHDEQDNCDGE